MYDRKDVRSELAAGDSLEGREPSTEEGDSEEELERFSYVLTMTIVRSILVCEDVESTGFLVDSIVRKCHLSSRF
jgi:hypothetical protein